LLLDRVVIDEGHHRRPAAIELDDDGDETDGLRPNSDGDDDY
jgi:hypothetical protein